MASVHVVVDYMTRGREKWLIKTTTMKENIGSLASREMIMVDPD